MAQKKKRELSQEETILWRKVVKQIEKIDNAPLVVHQKPLNSKIVKPQEARASLPMQRTTQKTRPTQHLTPSFLDAPAKTSPNMDRRNFQRLLKGKLEIDGTLDLHGLTTEQARVRLHSYIQNAQKANYRLLLVITGKGKFSGYDEFNRPKIGVLKQGVPEWLKSSQLSSLVLQVTQAHGRHGGGGAFYVYLRRKR